jgi:hypothetical protein
LLSREQELEPNTSYNYRWWLGLIFPHIGKVRARRLSAGIVERAYRDLEADGYSLTTVRTLDLVLTKVCTEQLGRTLGARKPRESDDERPVWTLTEARQFDDYVRGDRLFPMWRLLLVTGLRRGELRGLRCGDLEPVQGTLTVRRQIVVEDPGSHTGFEAAQVPQRQAHPGSRPVHAGSAGGGGGESWGRRRGICSPAVPVVCVAAGQSHRPVQQACSGCRGAADRAASDPASDGIGVVRRRVWRS